MDTFALYTDHDRMPPTEAAGVGALLGLAHAETVDDVALADTVAAGFDPAVADTLAALIGRSAIVGPVVPEPTLRRKRTAGDRLSREISERLYELGRVLDAAGRLYRGDAAAIGRFLNRPHPLLHGRTPLGLAQSSSAGAEAVINLMRRADAGFAV